VTASRRIALESAIAVILFGCIPVVVKFISANPYTIGVFRLGVATAGVAILVRAAGRLERVSRREVAILAFIGLVFFLHWLLYFLAIKASTASIGSIGLSTYGIQLLVLGWIFRRAEPRALDAIAVVMAVAGAFLVVPSFDFRNDATLGMTLAVVSAFFYALLPILHQRNQQISGAMRALGQFGFALLFFALFLPKTEWTTLGTRDWAGLLFLAIGPTLIGHTLWVRVTTALSPSTTSIVYYGNLPVALVLSVVILGEPLTPRMLVGAGLIVGGSILGLAFQRTKRGGGESVEGGP
jgi:drug/metabolite transporter (DMT)-like permease